MFMQQFGYLSSFLFAVLTVILFVISFYVGYKHYDEPGNGGSLGLRYFLLSVLSLGIALLIFLTTENGFTFEILILSVSLVLTIGLFAYVNDLIQKATTKMLQKKNITSPQVAISKLIELFRHSISASHKEKNDKDKSK